MKTKLKKLWSGLLCIVLLMSLLPSTAFAADNTVTSLSIKVTEYELGKNIADIQITAENPGIEIQSAGVKRIDANGNLSDAIGTFESGVKYGVEIYLTGKSGYDVSGLAETNVTVNGENPDCFDSGSTMRVWYILNELKSSSVKSLSEESSESNVIDYDTNAQDTQAPSQNDESSTEAESDMQLANMPKAGADTYTFDSGVLTILAPAGLIDWKTDTAFGSADITKLVVGSAVSEVPATEFRSCDNIESITFEGDINLTSCTDPENTSKLLLPFENMKSLHNITFKGNANISDAFEKCAELEKVTFENTGRVGGYSLKECPKISSLTFNSAITLTDGALVSDSSNPNNALTELVFPAGSEVKNSLFSNYSALKSVTFEGDVELRQNVFNNCNALETVTFKGESTIGGSAFSNCLNIKALNFEKKVVVTDGALYTTTANPNKALTELVFPEGSKVENSLFSNYSALKSVTFEGDVKLTQGTFQNCNALETVTFKGESTIGGSSFSNCPNIKTLSFEKKVIVTDGALYTSTANPNKALTELVFPAGSEVENSLFSNYSVLKSVTFEGDVELRQNVFYNCNALETVTFKGESTIGGSAFSNCPNIKALNFEKKVIVTDGALYTTLENRNDALTELVFPEGSRVDNSIFYNYKALKSVTFEGDVELGQSVFCNCNALETVTFKGKSTIGGSAFSNCPSIKTLRFAKKTTLTDGAFYTDSDNLNRSLTELVFPDGSKVVNNLFMNYKALKSVTFEGDADLKQGVFSYCDALETVTFNGESVIGQSAFYDCPSLESVIFKKKTMLSESAFGCTEEKPNSAMTELVLPGDSTIKDGAFRNYSKLNKVTIKKGAKLGTKILPGCSALETFIFEADTPQDFESLTFTNFEPENITIYVPDVEKYKEALEKDTGSDLDKHYNIEFVDRLKKLHIHNLTLVPAKDAACTEEGNKAYYICDGCDKWFEDAEGKSEITDKTSVIIPATGHTLSNVPAKDATCTEEGNKAYYICDSCDKWFEDAEGKSEITDKTSVIIPATGHTLSNVPAKDATCTEEGNKAYYICDSCDKWFEDAEGKSEITDKTSVIISAAGHTLSDWKADDNSHWHECECGYKADVAQHSFKWVVDKEANATQKGAKHEECTVCGYKRASVEIPATGTTIAPTTTPTTTPATTPKKDSTTTSTTTTTSAVKNPKTGDNSNIFLWIVLLLISGGTVSCIIIYDKKRKYNMK